MNEKRTSVSAYTIGYALSLALTLLAYVMTAHHVTAGWTLMICLTVLAVSQLLIQLTFFLHILEEQQPRLRLGALLFALMVVVILVFGSLWIMKNLDYSHRHLGPTNESDPAIIKDEGYRQ